MRFNIDGLSKHKAALVIQSPVFTASGGISTPLLSMSPRSKNQVVSVVPQPAEEEHSPAVAVEVSPPLRELAIGTQVEEEASVAEDETELDETEEVDLKSLQEESPAEESPAQPPQDIPAEEQVPVEPIVQPEPEMPVVEEVPQSVAETAAEEASRQERPKLPDNENRLSRAMEAAVMMREDKK